MSNNLKRSIRARMANTGESYSTARAHILEARARKASGGVSLSALVAELRRAGEQEAAARLEREGLRALLVPETWELPSWAAVQRALDALAEE